MKLFGNFGKVCPATLPEVRKTICKTLAQMGLDTKTTKPDTYIVVNHGSEIGTISVKVTPREYTLVVSDAFGVLVLPIHPMYNGKKWKQDIITRTRYAGHEMRCRWTPEGHVINERFNDILRQTAMIDEVDFAKTGAMTQARIGDKKANIIPVSPSEVRSFRDDGECLPPHYATALYMGLLDY